MGLKDFKILDTIGEGAFASVVKVLRYSDQQVYAMKRVNVSQLERKELQNTLNEIRLLASIRHPYIVGYYDSFLASNNTELCLVLEYCGAGDLANELERLKRRRLLLDEMKVWRYFGQALEALKVLHDNGICHRDVKAANCFMGEDGNLKLGDLNISKRIKCGALLQTQTGTPYFMAPEIWQQQLYGTPADMWALGCLLYEIATLRKPFVADSFPELSEKVKIGRYSPLPSQYSEILANTVARLVQVNPKKRASARDLLSDSELAAILQQASVVWMESDDSVSLLDSIKAPFPSMIHRIEDKLPRACYPDARPHSPESWPARHRSVSPANRHNKTEINTSENEDVGSVARQEYRGRRGSRAEQAAANGRPVAREEVRSSNSQSRETYRQRSTSRDSLTSQRSIDRLSAHSIHSNHGKEAVHNSFRDRNVSVNSKSSHKRERSFRETPSASENYSHLINIKEAAQKRNFDENSFGDQESICFQDLGLENLDKIPIIQYPNGFRREGGNGSVVNSARSEHSLQSTLSAKRDRKSSIRRQLLTDRHVYQSDHWSFANGRSQGFSIDRQQSARSHAAMTKGLGDAELAAYPLPLDKSCKSRSLKDSLQSSSRHLRGISANSFPKQQTPTSVSRSMSKNGKAVMSSSYDREFEDTYDFTSVPGLGLGLPAHPKLAVNYENNFPSVGPNSNYNESDEESELSGESTFDFLNKFSLSTYKESEFPRRTSIKESRQEDYDCCPIPQKDKNMPSHLNAANEFDDNDDLTVATRGTIGSISSRIEDLALSSFPRECKHLPIVPKGSVARTKEAARQAQSNLNLASMLAKPASQVVGLEVICPESGGGPRPQEPSSPNVLSHKESLTRSHSHRRILQQNASAPPVLPSHTSVQSSESIRHDDLDYQPDNNSPVTTNQNGVSKAPTKQQNEIAGRLEEGDVMKELPELKHLHLSNLPLKKSSSHLDESITAQEDFTFSSGKRTINDSFSTYVS